jgi:spore coat protein U-like protein
MKCSNFLRSVLPAAILGCLALGFFSTSAVAGGTTTTNTFQVTATVQTACTVTGTTLAFGTYTGAAVQATSTLTITCTSASTPYSIGLNAGATSGATLTTRQMQIGGTGTGLNYTLTSVSYTGQNWGNSLATNWVTGTSSATAMTTTTQTVFGTIPSNQLVPPGSYADTITASITY